MAQLHFTLDSDFFVGLFSETKDEAFGKLMEALLNQVLQAESTEQLGANNYERSQERSDYRNGTRCFPNKKILRNSPCLPACKQKNIATRLRDTT